MDRGTWWATVQGSEMIERSRSERAASGDVATGMKTKKGSGWESGLGLNLSHRLRRSTMLTLLEDDFCGPNCPMQIVKE